MEKGIGFIGLLGLVRRIPFFDIVRYVYVIGVQLSFRSHSNSIQKHFCAQLASLLGTLWKTNEPDAPYSTHMSQIEIVRNLRHLITSCIARFCPFPLVGSSLTLLRFVRIFMLV